ncbi:DUF1146 family protein, partial [Enterococcus cecorum]|uniref:DUF1146 family protein n=5 Tax=Enterococcus cecorum TaxID=44008 RepID=UPI003C2F09A5
TYPALSFPFEKVLIAFHEKIMYHNNVKELGGNMLNNSIEQIVRFTSHLIWIYLAFWSLQSLNLQTLFKKQKASQIRVFMLLLAIGLGYLVSSFFFEILQLSKSLFIARLQ